MVAKPELMSRKFMLYVMCGGEMGSEGIVHYELLLPGQMIDSNLFYVNNWNDYAKLLSKRDQNSLVGMVLSSVLVMSDPTYLW